MQGQRAVLMKNLLILYNPYYQANVIESHLEVLPIKRLI